MLNGLKFKIIRIEDEKSESKSHFLDYGPNFGPL